MSYVIEKAHRNWLILGFGGFVCIVALGFFLLGRAAEDGKSQAESNNLAIEKSCIMLNNAIVQSTGGSGTSILIKELLTQAKEAGRPEVAIEYAAAVAAAPPVYQPDCEKLAANPEAIQAVPTSTPDQGSSTPDQP